jgi:hypothetical protein
MAVSLRTALTDARATSIPHAAVLPSVAGIAALGRTEARHLLLHPSFLIGTAFGLLILRGAFGAGGTGLSLGENVAWLVASLLLGTLVGTVLSSNVAALRARRDHVSELFSAAPAPPETRTAGLLAGLVLGPVALSVVLTALGWWAFRRHDDIGPYLDLFFAVQIPLAVAALGTIGIAVGRWIPSLFGGPIVIAVNVMTPIVWAVPWLLPSETDVDPAWHITYLVAAITTWVALALARDRRTALRFAVVAGSVALGIVAAMRQVPPGGW